MACILSFVLNNSRLCSKENWREPSALKLWNLGCPSYMICMKNLRFSSCLKAKVIHQGPPGSAKQGVTCIKGFFSRGWGGRNWHHFENREAPGKRRDPWNDKDHVTGIGHKQKVTNVMAQQDLWAFTCWAEFCQFLECKEIATGHNKKTGRHLFLLFRKVILLFHSLWSHHFVILPFLVLNMHLSCNDSPSSTDSLL